MASCLQLVLGKQKLQKNKSTNIFIVGVGGIGCQLLKNLSKSGFRKFTILDLDHIEETNLNRQFYFRSHHIGKGKAEIGMESLLQIDPTLEITAINGNIYDQEYDFKFYKKFDLLVSALDNIKARQHLAKMAVITNKPLIDAGTQAYNGQAKPNVRSITDCHNCAPAKAQESFATCTIRSRPQRPIHCAVYAKAFYDSFFGGQQSHTLKENLNYTRYITKSLSEYSEQELKNIGIELFDQLFNQSIKDIDDDGLKISFVNKVIYSKAINSDQQLTNPELSTYRQVQKLNQDRSIYEQEKIWSLKKYTNKFVESIVNLLKKKSKGQAPPKFQKDDHDCATLICTIMNLRAYNFMNFQSKHNKHKFLTLYECKDLAGKIQPAIASTNSIAAALQIRQIINIINNQFDKIRFVSIRNYHNEKIVPMNMSGPNIDCTVCSQKCLYFNVMCNMKTTTIGQFLDFANKNLYAHQRICYAGPIQLVNKEVKIIQNNDKISSNGIMRVNFQPVLSQTPLFVDINIVHDQSKTKIQLEDPKIIAQMRKQIISYHRAKHSQKMQSYKYDLDQYGYI